MPIGSLSVYPEVIRLVLLNNPKSILDLGIGYGMNGAGIRNWYSKDVELIGVDGWAKYMNPMWDCYTKVNIQTIESYIEAEISRKFDFIIMTDVIEHFTLPIGYKVIERLKQMLNPKGALIISTPAIHIEQGAWGGNELETHRSAWTDLDFANCGLNVIRGAEPCKYGHLMYIAEYINQ